MSLCFINFHFIEISPRLKCAMSKYKRLIPKICEYARHQDTVPEIIDSDLMCITNLFQNRYLAYFNPK